MSVYHANYTTLVSERVMDMRAYPVGRPMPPEAAEFAKFAPLNVPIWMTTAVVTVSTSSGFEKTYVF